MLGTLPMSPQFVEQCAEGQGVEDRAQDAKTQHEGGHETDVPAPGTVQHFGPTGETFSIGYDDAGLVALTERLVRCAPAVVVF